MGLTGNNSGPEVRLEGKVAPREPQAFRSPRTPFWTTFWEVAQAERPYPGVVGVAILLALTLFKTGAGTLVGLSQGKALAGGNASCLHNVVSA